MHFDSKINILVLKCLAALPYTVVVQNNHMRETIICVSFCIIIEI